MIFPFLSHLPGPDGLYSPPIDISSATAMDDLPAFLTRIRSEVVETGVDTRRATEGPGGVVDTTPRSPTERNAVDMPVSAAAVEAW